MIKLDYTVNSRRVKNEIKKVVEIQTWLNYENLTSADKIHVRQNFKGLPSKRGTSIGLSTTNPSDTNHPKTQNIINSWKFLEETGHYEMGDVNEMLIELVSASQDSFSQEEKDEIAASTDKLWLQFMKDIQNPETQLLLKSFGQYSLADKTFGWQLASSNLIRIKAQKPDATFVQTRKQWHDKYGRKVVTGAKKIGVIVPYNKSKYKNRQEINNFMRQIGYGDDISYDDLSAQQRHFIDVSLVAGEGEYFRLFTFFDVSDTVLINPNGPDKWAEEAGFDNNLTGHLNQAAIDFKASKNGMNADEITKIYNNEEGDIVVLTQALAKGIEKRFPDLGTSLPKGNNKNAYLKCYHDMLERVADRLIEEKAKIVKKENREQGIAIATTIIMCLTKISPDIVAKKLANNELTEESYFELRSIINSISWLIRKNLPQMENKTCINEMDIPTLDSVDELLNMIGMTRDDVPPTTDEESQTPNEEYDINVVKENFYQLFNRMNKNLLS